MRTVLTPYLPAFLSVLTLLGCSTAAKQEAKPETRQVNAADEPAYRELVKLYGADPDAVAAASKRVASFRQWTEAKGGLIHFHSKLPQPGAHLPAPDHPWRVRTL